MRHHLWKLALVIVALAAVEAHAAEGRNLSMRVQWRKVVIAEVEVVI